MAITGNHKLALLYMMRELLEKTDEDHTLNATELIRLLEGYGFEADRRTIYANVEILQDLGMRKNGIEVVSCPTCGRTDIDLISLANQTEEMVQDIPLDLKVAVMGCVVNGPGEAREADIAICGGKHEGLLLRHGEIIRRVPEEKLLSALREELINWSEGTV